MIYASGVWVLGETGEDGVDEDAEVNPTPIVDDRPAFEQLVLEANGVRGVVVRPGIVHGRGGGIPAMMVNWAREYGAGRYVAPNGGSDRAIRWPMVHVDDLADLFVLAAERAPAGGLMHGVTEPNIATSELARAADEAASGAGKAEPWPLPDAAEAIGQHFAEALALSQVVHSTRATTLGWKPMGPTSLDDLRAGSYATRQHR